MQSALHRDLFDTLSSVNRKLKALFDARVKAHGLTLSRARVLFALSRKGPLNQRELADELGLETPTIVRLLDGMEKQDFIERRIEPNDRRAKRIHMTAHGRGMAQEIEALAREIREQVMIGVHDADKETALTVLSAMAVNILHLPARSDVP